MKPSLQCNVKDVFDLRQRVLLYLQNDMLLEAQNILEHIMNQKPKQWPDYIQYFQTLERLGRHCSVVQLGKKCLSSLEPDPEGQFFIQLAILRSMIRGENANTIKELADTIKELANTLLADLESVAIKAANTANTANTTNTANTANTTNTTDTPVGYTPTFDKSALRAFLLRILSNQDRKEGKLTAARNQQCQAYQEDPWSNPETFVNLNPTLKQIGHHFEQENYLQCINLIKLSGIQWSENTGLCEKLAASYFSLKNASDLYALANTLRKSQPNSAIAHYVFGLYHQMEGRHEESREHFIKSKDVDPMYTPAWLALGHSFAAMGDHEQTLMSYAQIIRHIDDHCVSTLVAMAAEYHRVGKPVLASPFLSIALGVKPDDYGALNELGVLFFLRGEYREALDAFVRAEAVSTSRHTRLVIIRNRILTRLKLDHLHGNLTAMIDTIQVAIEDPVLRSMPFIQELAYYLTESMELKHHFLSEAIVGLSYLHDRHKTRGLVQRLVNMSSSM